ncbi:transcriptional regulator NrdR [Acidaminococcus sp. NSJ-142]|jgi:transcriptional repressor NrdR|uniref:transcriptional regulator NrdR n=1 Tax=Acidaminococcus TaxID=904 RepID=UPI000CF9D62A|nr:MULTISPECIES: transcriptional regulator NrdR [Acidaminococcus]MCD2434798.1 transcriptional regulator NrdR [Acidaminococcus hominis]MCH4095884.1 transcriptional regulator NrdR [Acidaminococcus provencensis]RHK02408.1 transcriptional repressor NrdR [Acidaminococcus sp. AM05-11]
MKCPFCSYGDSRVVDSRSIDNGASIRRRRECPKCGRRFTTYEKYEQVPLLVIKKDGRREMFDNKKLLAGLLRAFEKRPFSYEQIQSLASQIEGELRASGENEIKSTQIGETVMKYLEKIDQIAYVRFASVYRQFADVNSFMQEIQNMLKKGGPDTDKK